MGRQGSSKVGREGEDTRIEWTERGSLDVVKSLGIQAAGCKELPSMVEELLDKIQYDIAQSEVKRTRGCVASGHYKPQEISVAHVPQVICAFRDSEDLTETRDAKIGVSTTNTQEVQFIFDLTAAA